MGYVVSVRRFIERQDVLDLVAADASLMLARDDEAFLLLHWRHADAVSEIRWAQGQLRATSPADAAWGKLEELAARLGARVLGEEDGAPPRREALPAGHAAGRVTWLGRPVMVVALAALLAWRW